MPIVTAIYLKQPGSRFDFDYYREKHLPLIAHHWTKVGFQDLHVLRGTGTLDGGEAPVFAIALLRFESMDAIAAALADEDAVAAMTADIAHFTDVVPIMQVSENFAP